MTTAPKRGRGRPPLPPEQRTARETGAKVRLSAAELADYREAHGALGLTMAGTARERWDEVLERATREGLMRRQRRGEG